MVWLIVTSWLNESYSYIPVSAEVFLFQLLNFMVYVQQLRHVFQRLQFTCCLDNAAVSRVGGDAFKASRE